MPKRNKNQKTRKLSQRERRIKRNTHDVEIVYLDLNEPPPAVPAVFPFNIDISLFHFQLTKPFVYVPSRPSTSGSCGDTICPKRDRFAKEFAKHALNSTQAATIEPIESSLNKENIFRTTISEFNDLRFTTRDPPLLDLTILSDALDALIFNIFTANITDINSNQLVPDPSRDTHDIIVSPVLDFHNVCYSGSTLLDLTTSPYTLLQTIRGHILSKIYGSFSHHNRYNQTDSGFDPPWSQDRRLQPNVTGSPSISILELLTEHLRLEPFIYSLFAGLLFYLVYSFRQWCRRINPSPFNYR